MIARICQVCCLLNFFFFFFFFSCLLNFAYMIKGQVLRVGS